MRKYGNVRLCAMRCIVGGIALLGAATNSYGALVISTGKTSNVSCFAGDCIATAEKATLNVNDLSQLLQASQTTLVSGSQAQDIEFDAPLAWTSSNDLLLDSYRSIILKKPLSVQGSGLLWLTTNHGGTDGVLGFSGKGSISFSSVSNTFVLNGIYYQLEDSLPDLVRDESADRNGNFALAADYDAKGDGAYTAAPLGIFGGRLEGLGHRISNLTINDQKSADYVGLFYELNPSAVIQNIILHKVSVTALNGPVGALVGDNQGTIFQCLADGTVTSPGGGAGGLVGLNLGTISRSVAKLAVTANEAGGLAGGNSGAINNSIATGSVTATSGPLQTPTAGGLVGGNGAYGTISSSYSTGAVTGVDGSSLGGAIGYDGTESGNSFVYWDVTSSGLSSGCGSVGLCHGVTGLTTEQLQSGLPAGFKRTIWTEKQTVADGLPVLRTVRQK